MIPMRHVLASGILVVSLATLGGAALAHDAPAPGDSGGGSGGPGEKTQISPSARTFFNQGEAYSKKKSWDLAVQAYAQAVRTDPKFAEAWNNMGYCYRRLQQYDKALDAYKHALDLKPAFTYAHEYMARTYIAMGNKDGAMREYEILKRLDTKMADELIKAIQANDADLGDTD